MIARIQLRRDTAAAWSAENPVLAAGEPGYQEADGLTPAYVKFGDGVTAWNDLAELRIEDIATTLDGDVASEIEDPTSATRIALNARTAQALARKPALTGQPVTSGAYGTGGSASTTPVQTTTGTSKTQMKVGYDASDLRMTVVSWRTNGAFEGSNPLEDVDNEQLTLKCGLRIGGVTYQLTFGGKRQIVIDPGGWAQSDPLPIEVTKGDLIYALIHTSGASWRPVKIAALNGSGWTATTDLTADGAADVADAFAYILMPAVITGTPKTPSQRSVAIWGDSVAEGAGDGQLSDGHALPFLDLQRGGGGYLSRAFHGQTGIVKVARGSDRVDKWILPAGHKRRMMLMSSATDAITEGGLNDILSVASLPTIKASLVTGWKQLAQRGLRVWQPTLSPVSTSTDAWATVAGQTTNGNDPNRVGLNDWLRDGAPVVSAADLTAIAIGAAGLRAGQTGHPLHAFFEIADVLESSRNSGLWRIPNRFVSDGAMSVGSNIVTSATAAFTNADKWGIISVPGAGAAGARLTGYIGAIVSATQVTVVDGSETPQNAATAVTGATVHIGVMTIDGLHPSNTAHILAGSAVPVSTILAD